ncbi:hypothetical protein MUP46_02740 [Patescibacteria group bacterium]|nr:hypothetical protein [Patescibacteria group bacterium]
MLLKLSDFFQPLNFQTLSYFLILFIFLDILGTFVKKILIRREKDDESRIINWIIGLGVFVFIWFLLGFIVLPQRTPLIISVVALSLISIPNYLKNKEIVNLGKALWEVRIPILLISFLLPAVFVRASLPPYYSDEMAYHFISPSALVRDLGVFWKFNGGLYMNLPRNLDTFFILIFSLTRTYSIARLFHFLILATSLLFAFRMLRAHFNYLVGFLFVFIFLSLRQGIVFVSTLGFVDVGTFSFLLIGLVYGIAFLLKPKRESLLLSMLFWALAFGTKYTVLTAFASFLLVSSFIVFWFRKKYIKIINRRTIIKSFLLLTIFGGYWYLKNLYFYGNPVYPFIFHCAGRYAADCPWGSGFFSGWTTKVNMQNFYPIIKTLLSGNKFLHIMVFASPLIVLLNKNRKVKLISLFLIASFLLELLMLKYFSGFLDRYHQHLQLLLMVLISVQFFADFSDDFLNLMKNFALVFLSITVLFNYVDVVKETNSLKFLNWNEINYSIGRANIYDWVRYIVPRMAEATFWCENPPDGKAVPLARFDPDMIWYENDGMMRSFMTNCYYENPPLEGLKIDEVIPAAIEKKMEFWTATPNTCISDRTKVVKRFPYEDDNAFYLRKLNNEIVCNSQEVLPNLYFFDYKKLNGNTKI